ncbi:hypothetical protein, partial [Stutzerimonas stutzeri]|uniref:hypothetical protein n=1 Tax=Stutzerimonas stutzeri TaxID=316 RepID=UPI0021088FAC
LVDGAHIRGGLTQCQRYFYLFGLEIRHENKHLPPTSGAKGFTLLALMTKAKSIRGKGRTCSALAAAAE